MTLSMHFSHRNTLDMDAILKSDPQKMAADLSRLAQVLQALSADLETRAAQEPSRKEVEE